MFEIKHIPLYKSTPDLLIGPCYEQFVVVICLIARKYGTEGLCNMTMQYDTEGLCNMTMQYDTEGLCNMTMQYGTEGLCNMALRGYAIWHWQ